MNVVTPEFRVSYPNVFKARHNELNGKDEYSLVALFDKAADLTKLKAAVTAAIEKKWGKDPKRWPKLPNGESALRLPFRDQADRAKHNEETGKTFMPSGYVEGAKYINLKNERQPGIINGKREPILDASEFYAGCYARASVQAFAYDTKGNRGVAFSLQNLQKVRDGEPFGNRTKAEDDFEEIGGAAGETDGAGAGSIFD